MSTEHGKVIGKKAPDFILRGINGEKHKLSGLCEQKPVLLCFFPGGPVKPVCSAQFCDYRDNYEYFKKFNLNIIGVSSDSIENQKAFARKNNYPFLFLTDPGNQVASIFKTKSYLMLGKTSRAVFIINQKQLVLYRYVEPTWFTKRGSSELVGILQDLKDNNLI